MARDADLGREGVQLVEAVIGHEMAPVPERQPGVRVLAQLVDQDRHGRRWSRISAARSPLSEDMTIIDQSTLAQTIDDNGGRHGALIVAEAQRAGIPIPLACALVEQESSFRNVFGHDAVQNPIPKGSRVTRQSFERYRGFRDAGLGAQGVGVTQLTFPPLQDKADDLGGCWKVGNQLRVGYELLAELIARHGVRGGLAAYNAGTSTSPAGLDYARRVLAHRRRWKSVLA
jgi:hypothetical protein